MRRRRSCKELSSSGIRQRWRHRSLRIRSRCARSVRIPKTRRKRIIRRVIKLGERWRGGSRIGTRQWRKGRRRTRLRSGANMAKRGDRGSEGKPRGTSSGAKLNWGDADAADNTGRSDTVKGCKREGWGPGGNCGISETTGEESKAGADKTGSAQGAEDKREEAGGENTKTPWGREGEAEEDTAGGGTDRSAEGYKELQWERCLKDLLVHPRRHLKKKKKNQISVSITLSNSILNCSTLALFTASAGSLFHIGAILYVKKFPHWLVLNLFSSSFHPFDLVWLLLKVNRCL